MDQFSQHKDTPKHVTNLARQFRKEPTPQEKKLWNYLSGKKLSGLKFRRQHPIGRYIADFYNHQHRLAVEIDGKIHNNTKEYDLNRDKFLKAYNIRILRFSNNQVETNIEEVLSTIKDFITPSGGGEPKRTGGVE